MACHGAAVLFGKIGQPFRCTGKVGRIQPRHDALFKVAELNIRRRPEQHDLVEPPHWMSVLCDGTQHLSRPAYQLPSGASARRGHARHLWPSGARPCRRRAMIAQAEEALLG